jgi:hypothetical protein
MFNVLVPALFAGHTHGFLIGIIVGFVMMMVMTAIHVRYLS